MSGHHIKLVLSCGGSRELVFAAKQEKHKLFNVADSDVNKVNTVDRHPERLSCFQRVMAPDLTVTDNFHLVIT